jgi:hypothetical protein
MFGDGAEVELPADFRGQVFERRHVALLANKGFETDSEGGGELGSLQLIDFDATERNALDHVALVDIGFSNLAYETLPGSKTGSGAEQKTQQKKRHWEAGGTLASARNSLILNQENSAACDVGVTGVRTVAEFVL